MKNIPLEKLFTRKLIFVGGKGGVGKTCVSQAIALTLSEKKRVLWVGLEDPLKKPGELIAIKPTLFHLNCDPHVSFHEFITIRLGSSPLTSLFLNNKIIHYLSEATPGFHDLVVMGKIWHERNHYDHVIIDMPSTGYGVALFQSVLNFSRLFQGGPVHRDALAMHEFFGDEKSTGHVIVALPEEMPLREALDLEKHLDTLFPKNPAAFVANRLFPQPLTLAPFTDSDRKSEPHAPPYAKNAAEYADKRSVLETQNLKLWEEKKLIFQKFPYIAPPLKQATEFVVKALAEVMGTLTRVQL